ncbi:YrhB domain-containing protein [Spirillospora sp. CA-294931]|uniref:YrhB domain-containing protein n=1 Tax=Spirillospora sp. CA-294931 TaxID=3240042 RepID=UPI003D9141E0
MDAEEAVGLVEAWMRTRTGKRVTGGPRQVCVDRRYVLRGAEGWAVPYDRIRAVVDGDPSASIVPKPSIIVRVPGGELRLSTGRGGPSLPVPDAKGVTWNEHLEPGLANSGVAFLGFPREAIIAWGTDKGELRPNPEWKPGPARLGYPPAETKLDHLLAFHDFGWLDRERFLLGLLNVELLIPAGSASVYSSPRWLPQGTTRWLCIDTGTFMQEFPEASLSINPGGRPGAFVTAEELRWASSRTAIRPQAAVRRVEEATELPEPVRPITGAFVGFALGDALESGGAATEALLRGEPSPRPCDIWPGVITGAVDAARRFAADADRPTADAVVLLAGLFARLYTDRPFLHDLLAERDAGVHSGVVAQVLDVFARPSLDDAALVASIKDPDPQSQTMGRALAAVVRCTHDPEKLLMTAAAHPGSGALAGALIGARVGVPGLPQDLLSGLESRTRIEATANQLYRALSPGPS